MRVLTADQLQGAVYSELYTPEGRMQVLRVANSLVFSQGLFTVGETVIARCNGILKPVSEPDPRYDGRRYFTG